jgi:flagellar hook-associated protein 1
MSISGTLSSALSGLNASSRAAELVSSNVANALTDGYSRRELVVGARALGGSGQGVSVVAVNRVVDRALLSDRRIAQAGAGARDLRAAFLTKAEAALGTPGSDGSLGARIAAFDKALIEAASRPESESRLGNVLGAAKALAAQLGSVSEIIQTARAAADDAIAEDVSVLNDTLSRIAEMNGQIRAHVGNGRNASALMDQRHRLIDKIATILPLREVERDHGQIALYTTGGAVLLDGRPAEFGFVAAGVITPDMTLGSGALSTVTLNGQPLRSSGDSSLILGGRLAASFAIRDELAPGAQARLDAVARDLIARFADPGVDPTRSPDDAGLFTDKGAAFNATDEAGIAARIRVNAAVDPTQGGALWRLRDGQGAISPGPSGNSSLLSAFQVTLTDPRSPVSGGFMAGARSFSALAADLVSGVAAARLAADEEASFATAKADSLRVLELETGVDTDREMQQLLLIEQAYAANAKVVQSVDNLIQLLLGM